MAQDYAPELEVEKQPARALVERIAAELRKAVSPAELVTIGDAANTILGQAVEWMPSDSGRFAWEEEHSRFPTGQRAESVARRAECSWLSFAQRSEVICAELQTTEPLKSRGMFG